MAEHGLDWFMVGGVDGGVAGWASESDIETVARVADVEPQPLRTTLTPESSLRDGLDAVVSSHTRVAAVFDGATYLGILTLDQISEEVLR